MPEALPYAWWITPIGSTISLIFAYVFYREVMKQSEGTPVMVEIAQAVRDGAMAYLKQQLIQSGWHCLCRPLSSFSDYGLWTGSAK